MSYVASKATMLEFAMSVCVIWRSFLMVTVNYKLSVTFDQDIGMIDGANLPMVEMHTMTETRP